MFIQTMETPNPATLKFLPGCEVMPSGQLKDFPNREAAQASPLAARLFDVDGVAAIFFGHDFISVTKQPAAAWPQIKPDILGVIMDHLTSGQKIFEHLPASAPRQKASDDEETASRIREIIDTRVRPAVAQDGGDIVFDRLEKGIVYLQMRGACSGCPSSTVTLKHGIENLLRYYVPEISGVEASEDL